MKRRDWDKKRKPTMMVTVPVSTIWRFFKRWRDERRRKKISAALLKRRRDMKRD